MKIDDDGSPLGITYRKDFGCWWPNYDRNPERCHAFVQRRLKDADLVLRHVRGHRCVVQAGGHAGYWPIRLAESFGLVMTFECEPALYECLVRNVRAKGLVNVTMSKEALGPQPGRALMTPAKSAGSWAITSEGTVAVDQITIDSLNLSACDAIILDVEGYELEVLHGARTTIERFSPVLHLEASHPKWQDEFMRQHDYKLVSKAHGDRVFVRSKT